MPGFHSQQDEDKFIWYLLSENEVVPVGVFVDVGALDGVAISNTLFFEEMGWTGVCIEPHPAFFLKLCKNRPNSICFKVLIGDRQADAVDFYITDKGGLSSIIPDFKANTIAWYSERAFEGWHKIQMPMVTLDYLLSMLDMPTVDVVSIDVEAAEKQVLAGFTPSKWNVHLMVLEISYDAEMIVEQLAEQGYYNIGKFSNNFIFSNLQSDIAKASRWGSGG